MNKLEINYPNKTAEYFYKISNLSFLFGMPNFWIEELAMSKVIIHVYANISKFCNLALYVFIPFELAAFVTQNNLTSKQEADRVIYCIAHPFVLMYAIVTARRAQEIQEWISHVLQINAVYCDPRVEDQMVRKCAFNSAVMVVSCATSMMLHSVSAGLQVIRSEGTYTTVITAWPLVDEVSAGADSVRIIINIAWWVLLIRFFGTFIFVISLTTCMSFQFKNLQSFFLSLEPIFNEDLEQSMKEQKYEDGMKTGIRLHAETMACVNRLKKICGVVYSGQIVLAITVLVFLMMQMLRSDRTLVNTGATALTAAAVLSSTGFFMWNAGDITIEASNSAKAMYFSGWHHCRGRSSKRIRTLLAVGMIRAQFNNCIWQYKTGGGVSLLRNIRSETIALGTLTEQPEVLRSLGVMALSYESFLQLVKTSYSVFSVLY